MPTQPTFARKTSHANSKPPLLWGVLRHCATTPELSLQLKYRVAHPKSDGHLPTMVLDAGGKGGVASGCGCRPNTSSSISKTQSILNKLGYKQQQSFLLSEPITASDSSIIWTRSSIVSSAVGEDNVRFTICHIRTFSQL